MTDRCLINIPADGNYIEILGHRIDGFESFETFLDHLEKYAVLEETVKNQKVEIDRLNIDLQAMRGAANSYKKESQDKERRLKGILPIVAVIKEHTVKNFSHFLIDKAENGVISIANLPSYAIDFQKVGVEE